ncbi:MAG: hypothetical protein IJ481_01975, partial [Alphaproteobacteria bacterium]|nr:hypothetical protein [Alphaproteobacteria bacterium]
MFNRDEDNSDTYWMPNNTVTIDEDYKLKLINNYNSYYYVLNCNNTFTNNGNVIIKDNAYLDIGYNDDTSINNGTIDI